MRALAGLVLGALLLASSCIIVADDDSTVTVSNESSYTIIEINLTPSYSDTWGPDLLGPDVLYPGESLTIDYVDCGAYDMRIVDHTGVECTFWDYDLCWDNDLWVITNSMLDDCAFN